jgi:hypothetical protein
MNMPEDQSVRARRTRTRSLPIPRRFRNVRLVREMLRAENRLMKRPQDTIVERRRRSPDAQREEK